jgi:hypothetical protein
MSVRGADCEQCKCSTTQAVAVTAGMLSPQCDSFCSPDCVLLLQILRRPRIGGNNRLLDMRTRPQKLTRRCEVTAILVLYGLPRSGNFYLLSLEDITCLYLPDSNTAVLLTFCDRWCRRLCHNAIAGC